MSNEVETSFVQQFTGNVTLLTQQKGSKLRQFVDIEPVKGEFAYVEQIGQTAAKVKESRHGDTPVMNTKHDRRRLQLVSYEWGDLIDNQDKVRMLIDPTSPYALNAAMAMGRAMDVEIYDAALGTAYTGKKGETPVTLPSARKIAANSEGLTFAKLTSIKKLFDDKDVEENDRIIVYTAQQLTDLLNDAKATSQEYNAAQVLMRGEIDTFMGFKFIQVNGVRDNGTKIVKATTAGGVTTRHCLAFQRKGLRLGIGEDIVGKITERADKSFSTQVYYEMLIGATRLEENCVVQFDCKEP